MHGLHEDEACDWYACLKQLILLSMDKFLTNAQNIVVPLVIVLRDIHKNWMDVLGIDPMYSITKQWISL